MNNERKKGIDPLKLEGTISTKWKDLNPVFKIIAVIIVITLIFIPVFF